MISASHINLVAIMISGRSVTFLNRVGLVWTLKPMFSRVQTACESSPAVQAMAPTPQLQACAMLYNTEVTDYVLY